MSSNRVCAAVGFALLFVFAVACDTGSRPTPTPTVDLCTRFPALCAVLSPGPSNAPVEPGTPRACPGGDLEGCYAYSEMFSFLDEEVEEHTRNFINEVFAQRPPVWPAVKFASGTESFDMACTGKHDTETFAYCSADRIIYVGHDALWLYYDEIGDAAAVAGFVHEFGHHLQTLAGAPIQSADRATGIQIENQADCVAGAFIGWAEGKGLLNQEDDIGDLVVLVGAIASLENDPNRDHGTIAERADSMDLGIGSGIFGCNSFFPATPLIVSL